MVLLTKFAFSSSSLTRAFRDPNTSEHEIEFPHGRPGCGLMVGRSMARLVNIVSRDEWLVQCVCTVRTVCMNRSIVVILKMSMPFWMGMLEESFGILSSWSVGFVFGVCGRAVNNQSINNQQSERWHKLFTG